MTDWHIINILEEKPFDSLTEQELSSIHSHITVCHDCNKAYDASRVAAILTQARASETVEVSPFFRTRVMAAIRDGRLAPEEPALLRMWRAAGLMVSTFAGLLVILAGLTFFSDGFDSQGELASQNLYSPEYVVLQRGDDDVEDLAPDQVVSTIYDMEIDDDQ